MEYPWFQYPQYEWQDRTVTIIGAGIAGRQVAWHLAEQGWKVTLLERNSALPEEASGNVAGIISPKVTAKPSPGESFYVQCFNYVLRQLKEHPEWSTDWNQSGVIQLIIKERDKARWQQLSERNLPDQLLQCLSPEQASVVSQIPIKHQALYFPEAGWIKPKSFCSSLVQHANIEFKSHSEALELNYTNNNWHVTDRQQNIIACSEAVVICSGKNLNYAAVEKLPYIPIAGQTTLVRSNVQGKSLKTVIDHEGYITPRIDNENAHIMGATYERDSLDVTFSDSANQQNLEKQQRFLPGLAEELHDLEHGHSAIRMTTPDRLPYLGAVPDFEHYQTDYADLHHGKHWKHYPNASYYPNLFIAAAFASRGLTTSALCAKTLACLMDNKELPISDELLHALHPARFWVRDLKRGKSKT